MYPLETRYKAVVHYKFFDRSLRRVARAHGVSKSSLQRWTSKDPSVRRRPKRRDVVQSVRECIEATLATDPCTTMERLSGLVSRTCGVRPSRFSVARYVKRIGWTRKKVHRTVEHAPSESTVRDFCSAYLERHRDIVSIDEVGFYVADAPRRGYAPRGKRLNIGISRTVRRSKMTLLLAVSKSGVVYHEILDHNCRKADFVAFVERLPVARGTTLLMDNVQFHHSKETLDAVAARGCNVLYTPPYSPRFNAVEYVFGGMKRTYRAECPRVADEADDFDFAALLEAVVATQGRYERHFAHVLDQVRNTSTASIATYTGYDV